MTRPARFSLSWILAGLISPLAPQVFASDEPSQYQLDLIVFKQLYPQSDELFDASEGPVPPKQAILIGSGFSRSVETLLGKQPLMPAGGNTLDEIERKLRSSRGYRPLWSGSWKVSLNQGESRVFLFEPDAPVDENQTLVGHFTVELSRYLHLDTDLALVDWQPYVAPDLWEQDSPFLPEVTASAAVTEPERSWLPWGEAAQAMVGAGYEVKDLYRINQRHRTPSGKINYQDHPYFGIIFQFTRMTAPEPVSNAATGSEPAPSPGQ